jgi:hypothetical protein
MILTLELPDNLETALRADRIRELSRGNILPEGFNIRDFVDQGRD